MMAQESLLAGEEAHQFKANDEETQKQLRDMDLNDIIRTRGLLDLDLIEKVLEAKKREAIIARRRQ
jgi:hypothetical protein